MKNVDESVHPSPSVWREGVEVALLMGSEAKFPGASVVLCNELKSRFRARRVSLGWLEGGRVELAAVSHAREFDRRSREVNNLCRAMEECIDQDEELFWPAPGASFVNREHERLAGAEELDALVGIPLRVGDNAVAALLLERNEELFGMEEIYALRVAADLIAPRLADLRGRSRWVGMRVCLAFRDFLAGLLGPSLLWWKMMAILFSAFIVTAFFLPWEYRVDADFSLKTDAVVHVTAPFSGFIGEVHVTAGDPVEDGRELLVMDTRDLEVNIAEAEVKRSRHEAEERAARGKGEFAEAESSRLRIREAEAELTLLKKRLERATLPAPFGGLVIEGDLRERVGSPVKEGDLLFKVARPEGFYARLEVEEQDVRELKVDASGELSFLSRPGRHYGFRVVRIEPAAQSTKDGNVFRLRTEFTVPAEEWWRPGMEGVAKISVGERTLLWVLTRRAIDWVRLKFWF